MFTFSFIGGLIAPYKESQVFKINEVVEKDYAGVAVNTDFQYINAEGEKFPSIAKAQLILAINNKKDSFVAKDVTYSVINEGKDFYRVVEYQNFAKVVNLKGINRFNAVGSGEVTKEMKTAYEAAVKAGETSFDLNGTTYYIVNNGKNTLISLGKDISMVSKLIFNAYSPDTALTFAFHLAAEKAMNASTASFDVDGKTYEMEYNPEDNSAVFYIVNGDEKTAYAMASTYSINAVVNEFLTIEFREAAKEAVLTGSSSFNMKDKAGNDVEYTVIRKNNQYTIRKNTTTQLIDIFSAPSLKHPAGTDGNGMDLLTRLMFGGRISLMIGFVVIFLEIIIGVILGGIAGYFGKWVDMIIMRFVDIMYCIPTLPLFIILGSIMDFMKVPPGIRIYALMIILAIFGWPGIARMVRGQILSLREQEFMTAEEALGISVSRRIFKHLVPNVIPQLTVIATMGLGDIILVEATLSFLGLGVKFPLASWGNIINAVSNIYVMKNYWFVWIPAGLLILVTVLGFNFIGDGLRDAFDPKMKR
jgi:peptide/nickel transport system permease protein